jgi:hypothetical protein
VWRGEAGPGREQVSVDVVAFGDGAGVHVVGVLLEAPEPTPALAQALLRENDSLLFGRLRHVDGHVLVEHTVLGGHTLHPDEVRIVVWALGWATGAYRPRVAARLAGLPVPPVVEPPAVEARRGAEERVASTEVLVERVLRDRYGSFERDPAWGYHGGFGSTRVFCSVSHYLEVSTVVRISSPVLLGVEPADELAVEAGRLMAVHPVGRLSWSEPTRELWLEHAILGDDLDARELEAAIDAVAALADAEDDRLQARFGGRRYADLA